MRCTVQIVLLAALGVGGATVLGAVFGFMFKKISLTFNDIVLSFAGGVMLSAAMVGLVFPALEMPVAAPAITVTLGIFAGALVLHAMDMALPLLYRAAGLGSEVAREGRSDGVLLLVAAMAIHNLPEGLAAGVGFGTDNMAGALAVAMGIALQNIPEGMVIIAPMLGAGISRGRTFLIALSTGVIEVIGTVLGYYATALSEAILPFALSFAAGTMLFVVAHEMIPSTHREGGSRAPTYALLLGFCLMLLLNSYL